MRGRRSEARRTFAHRRCCRGVIREGVQLGRANERLSKERGRMSCTEQAARGRAAGAGWACGVGAPRQAGAGARLARRHAGEEVAKSDACASNWRRASVALPCGREVVRAAPRRRLSFGRASAGEAGLHTGGSAAGQVRAHRACALQRSRGSAPSALIPQPASIGAVDTLACGLLAAGLAWGAWRWKRSPRGANGDAIGLMMQLRTPRALPRSVGCHKEGALWLFARSPAAARADGARRDGAAGACEGIQPHVRAAAIQLALALVLTENPDRGPSPGPSPSPPD